MKAVFPQLHAYHIHLSHIDTIDTYSPVFMSWLFGFQKALTE